MPDASVDGLVGISGPFRPELPDGPIISMFGVEEGDKAVEGVSVGSLRIGLAGAGPVGGKGRIS